MQSLAQRLFSSHGVDRFLAENWRLHRPFFMHAPLERLAEIATRPQLSSVSAYLDSTPPRLKAWLRKGIEHYGVMDLNAAQARKLWDTGDFTIVGDDVDRHVPIIGDLLRSVKTELGYSIDCGVHANLYMARPGKGSRAHFDKQEVISFQIRGSKRWSYSPNQHVLFPSEGYFGAHRPHPLLEKQLDGQTLPDVLPSQFETVELVPGSVLFLPRGMWHETVAGDQESIAITLTFTTRTWTDLVTELVADTLIRQPKFREPLPPVLAESDHVALVKSLRGFLTEAHALVRDVDAAALALRHFGLTRSMHFARTQVPARLEQTGGGGGRAIVGDGPESVLDLEPPLVRWVESVVGTPNFVVESMIQLVPQHVFGAARALAWAEDNGVLVRRAS